MEQFPVKLNLRLDWSEMDLFGHINNVMFMKYIQSSRVNYWEHIKLTNYFEKTNCGPMLASTICNFFKPLHYPGNITIEARLEFIKTTSFGLHHRILNEKNEIAAEAHDAMVLFDFNKNQKTEIPAVMREEIQKVEKQRA